MNKTTTANIGSVIFHIDVDAYDKLQHYLNAIGKYFDRSQGKDEIMADIEARIAEIFKERKSNAEQVIGLEDVNEVIKIMGEPEQYADTEAEEDYEPKERHSSYRSSKRRIFRDPDNKHLGGVCSGVGYYFGIDPVWIRLFFIIAFLGWGSGLFLYIILWLIIPEAKTTAEKLEMKGEPINVDNIGKTIDEEMHKVKEQFNDFANRAKTKKFTNDVSNNLENIFQFLANIFSELFKFLGKVISVLFRVLGKVIGIAFVVFGIIALIFLIGSWVNSASLLSITSEGFHYYSLEQLFSYISDDPVHWMMLIIASILFIGMPVLATIYWGIKLLFPLQTPHNFRGIGLTFFGLWLIGLVIAVVLIFQIGMEFKNEARVEETVELQPLNSKVLYIDINDDVFSDELDDTFDDKYSFQYINDNEQIELFRFGNLLFQQEGQEYFVGIPKLNIRKSKTDKIQLILKKYADGLTIRQAESRARSINYTFQQDDSTLVFDPVFEIEDEMLFRDQSLKIELRIPKNTVIDLSESSERLVYNYGNLSSKWIKQSYWHWKMGGYKWIMLDDGLSCLNCEDSALDQLDSTQQEIVKRIDL